MLDGRPEVAAHVGLRGPVARLVIPGGRAPRRQRVVHEPSRLLRAPDAGGERVEVPPAEQLWEGECFVFDERVTLRENLEKGNSPDLSQRRKRTRSHNGEG